MPNFSNEPYKVGLWEIPITTLRAKLWGINSHFRYLNLNLCLKRNKKDFVFLISKFLNSENCRKIHFYLTEKSQMEIINFKI